MLNGLGSFIFICHVGARFWGYNFMSLLRQHRGKEYKKLDIIKLCNWPNSCKFSSVVVFSIIMIVLSFAAPTVGYCRDNLYINGNTIICAIFVFRKSTDCNHTKNKYAIITLFAISKFFVLLTESVVRIIFVMIIITSIKKWETDIVKLKTCTGQKEGMRTKYFRLYNHYIEIGKSSQVERDTLKEWFFIEYLSYFLAVIVELVHVTHPLFSAKSKCTPTGAFDMYNVHNVSTTNDGSDILHSVLYILFDLIGFFILFMMATYLNKAHEKYYRKMLREYYKYEIPTKGEGPKKFFKPGFVALKCSEDPKIKERLQLNKPDAKGNSNDEVSILVEGGNGSEEQGTSDNGSESSDTRKGSNSNGGAEDTQKLNINNYYKVYGNIFIQAMEKNIPKRSDFDFVPSFFNINIPLDSAGYNFTILLSFVAIIFNFTTLS